MAKEEKEYSKKETQERFDAMLKGALKFNRIARFLGVLTEP